MGLLSTPLNGLLRIFEEVADRAEQEIFNEDAVKAELMSLHASLEAGTISEEEFEEKELMLVERLQEIEAHNAGRRRRVVH